MTGSNYVITLCGLCITRRRGVASQWQSWRHYLCHWWRNRGVFIIVARGRPGAVVHQWQSNL